MGFVLRVGRFMRASVHFCRRNCLPAWPARRVPGATPAKTNDAEGAMPVDDPHNMVRLTAAENPLRAQICERTLRQGGVHCQVLGHYLDAGSGDSSGFSAEVWVEAADLSRAKAILREHQGCCEEVVRPDETP